MTDIIVIIISVAVGVVAGNLVQGVINSHRIGQFLEHIVVEHSEDDCEDGQCGDCECCSCSGEDDE